MQQGGGMMAHDSSCNSEDGSDRGRHTHPSSFTPEAASLMLHSLFSNSEAKDIHTLCRDGNLQIVGPLIEANPSCLEIIDTVGQLPLHAACANQRMYAWMVVKTFVEEFPEGARLADEMGQLPLHIAARNEGPFF
eukprot:CAMPEP_0206276160 /NCGR_PEP_ID=MMETSP0047_2-20121206/36150_1 /ASSEMBLY_ACC=CAM_ASM_000192 /TAXON_ID=195065 /ORGANISM="Chroomonas mesostigmatica_cf, Strain CCMP1168" /LENGTH=134 /DNA_ID=CAMNT_0053705643 /DNA_START=69 /DNA_END=470 /DNA_ORIENTATION=-